MGAAGSGAHRLPKSDGPFSSVARGVHGTTAETGRAQQTQDFNLKLFTPARITWVRGGDGLAHSTTTSLQGHVTTLTATVAVRNNRSSLARVEIELKRLPVKFLNVYMKY